MTKQTLCGSNRPVFGILSIAFLWLCGFASAETYYVAMNGNDSNPGTIDAPQRTIQRAANLASPGDTVIVRDGTYGHVNAMSGGDGSADNFSPVVLYRSGAPGAEITFKAENKWGAILDCEMLCDSYDWFLARRHDSQAGASVHRRSSAQGLVRLAKRLL